MFFGLLALISVLGAVGIFAWLVIERARYFRGGQRKHLTIQMILTVVCISLLLCAVGFYAMDDASRRAA
jgi:Na+/H+ antiporter NhaD/arsenite permease-like protein